MSYGGKNTNTRTECSKVSKGSLNMRKVLNVILQYKSTIYIYWNMKCTKNDLVHKKNVTEPRINSEHYMFTLQFLYHFSTH